MGLDITLYKVMKYKENHDIERIPLYNDKYEYNNPYPSWTKKFEVSHNEEFYDWDKYIQDTHINVNDYEWSSEEYSEEGCFLFLKDKQGNKLKIDLEKVPTKKIDLKVLGIKEIGYQRKGLNAKFYEDYRNGLLGYYVWSKKELERYMDEYCDEHYDTPEFDENNNEITPKTDFYKNIISKFKEGRDCVSFDW